MDIKDVFDEITERFSDLYRRIQQLEAAATIPASGAVGGSGTLNYIPLWTAPTTLGDSIMMEAGAIISILNAVNPQLRINETADLNSYLDLIDVSTGQAKIEKIANTGVSQLDLNPLVNTGTTEAQIRFFRETNTTDDVRFRIYKGDNTANINHEFLGDGDSYIGNLGHGLTIGSTLLSANMTIGWTVKQGTNDDEAGNLQSTDVAAVWASVETNTYARLLKADSNAGGLLIDGFRDADSGNYQALVLRGFLAENVDITKSTGGRAIIEATGLETDSANLTNTVANGNVFGIRTRRAGATVSILLADEDGDIWIAGSFHSTDQGLDPATPANAAGFYGKDVGGTTKAFVIDEAGNVTQLNLNVSGTVALGAGTITSATANDATIASHVHALDVTGVIAGNYGNATQVGTFTVDTKGRLTAAANVAIAGVPPAAHNILSASHGDTVAQAVSRGSLIYGNASPAWDELNHPAAAGYALTTDANDVLWDQTPNWSGEHVFDAGLEVSDDQDLIFGSNDDATIRYDEAGDDRVEVSGVDWHWTIDDFTLLSTTSLKPELTLENTNADANSARISFYKNSVSPADNDNLGVINFYGETSTGAQNRYAVIQSQSLDVTNGDIAGNLRFVVTVDANERSLLELKGYNGSVNEGEIIFNEDAQDVDFRVEAIGVSDAIEVQGSDGQITLGVLTSGYVKSSAAGVLSVSTTVPLTDLASYTQGDIIYGSVADWADLAISGNNYDLLGVNAAGTEPSWQTFDWDLHIIAAGGDGVHDHSNANEGGTLPASSISHTILNANYHTDSVTQAVSQGSLIYGDTTPDWNELIVGGAHFLLKVNAAGTLPAWSAFDWDNISIAVGADMVHDHSNNAEGGTLPAGSISHTVLDGSVHTDTVTQAVTRGSIIYGNNTPAWDELVHPGASRFLTTDANDVLWSANTFIINGNTLITGGGTIGLAGFTLSVPATGTAVLGVGGANRVTYWTGVNTVSSDVGLQVDTANDLYVVADSGGIGNSNTTARLLFDSSGVNYADFEDCQVFINDTTNALTTIALTINQGANDDNILAFKSSDVATGGSPVSETDDFAIFRKTFGAQGGVSIWGFRDTGAGVNTTILGLSSGNFDTTTSSAGLASVMAIGRQLDGAGNYADVVANGNVFGVRARVSGADTTVFLVDEDGDGWLGNSLFINEASNAFMITGITINQGTTATEMLAGKGNLTHPFTAFAEADTFHTINRFQAAGGVQVNGYKGSASDAWGAAVVIGYLGENADTTKTTAGRSIVEIQGFITDGGTGIGDTNSNGNVFGVRTERAGSPKSLMILDEDGDLWIGGDYQITNGDWIGVIGGINLTFDDTDGQVEANADILLVGQNEIQFQSTSDLMRSAGLGVIILESEDEFDLYLDTDDDEPADSSLFTINEGDTRTGGTYTQLLELDKEGDLFVLGKIDARTGGLNTIQDVSNVSNPPTDAELDAAFGTPGTLGRGFIGIVDDNDADTTVWLCVTTDASWYYEQMTKAV